MASTTFLLRLKYGVGSKKGTDKKTKILPSTVYNFSLQDIPPSPQIY